MKFRVVIPARHASQRLPGKPLLKIAGRPMLQHVFERAQESGADQVVIATDDERIAECAQNFGAVVCMTQSGHTTGSDRLAEVAELLKWQDDDIVVNLQGDEPLMPSANILQVAANLHAHADARMSTLCTPIHNSKEVSDPNIVKVVFDARGRAMYFSRAPIPFRRDETRQDTADLYAFRHIGLYAYRVEYLKAFCSFPKAEMENCEQLEQLRALWQGDFVHIEQAQRIPGPGVDTHEDYEWVCQLVSNMDSRPEKG